MKKNAVDVAGMMPLLQKLVALVGRRSDDPKLVGFVTKTLGQKKVPDSGSDLGSSKYVSAKKHGIVMNFNHNIKNERYPLIPRTKKTFVPYLGLAWLAPKFPEPLPFGLMHGMTVEQITKQLGEPRRPLGSTNITYWERVLDPARDVVFGISRGTVTTQIMIAVDQARELAPRYYSRTITGLFVAWAIQRNLLDESRFAAHAGLLAAVRKREKKGSDLVAAALTRGLWDTHLKDLPGLRDFVYEWLHNLNDSYITFDLATVFKGQRGEYGHREPVIEDDDWKAVQKATKAFDKRFSQWVKPA